MVAPRFLRMQGMAMAMLAVAAAASGDDWSNRSFQLQYDANGVTSLKRTGDVADTDYIAAGGALGRLIVRYRTTANGDWKELRELMLARRATATSSELVYTLGAPLPTLESRASGSAVQGVAGIRGLNDGVVPRASGAGGRGGGPGPAPGLAPDIPIFTWTPSRPSPALGTGGATQWVQYTFPTDETIGRTQVFWTVAPQSWRLLYQDRGEWKEVAPPSTTLGAGKLSYGREVNTFTTVEFEPVKTMALRIEVTLPPQGPPPAVAEWRVGAEPGLATPADLHVTETFALNNDTVDWTVVLANQGSRSVEIGDLAVPFSFAERAGARGDIYTKKLLRHSLVNGHGSWVYWQRSNAVGPYLVMTPKGAAKFEYYDSSGGVFTPYVHAQAASAAAKAAGGNWRLPISSLRLAPGGSAGSAVTYTFRFQWAKDAQGVRDVLYKERKFDTTIVPGMVVPSDLPANISLRSRNQIASIVAEHPSTTRVEPVADRPGVYSV